MAGAGPFRVFVYQCPYAVQCVKDKMGIDMGFDGFEFKVILPWLPASAYPVTGAGCFPRSDT